MLILPFSWWRWSPSYRHNTMTSSTFGTNHLNNVPWRRVHMPTPSWFYHFYDSNWDTCSSRSGGDLCGDIVRWSDVSFSNLILCLPLRRRGLLRGTLRLFFGRGDLGILCLGSLTLVGVLFIEFRCRLYNFDLCLFSGYILVCLRCFDTLLFSLAL